MTESIQMARFEVGAVKEFCRIWQDGVVPLLLRCPPSSAHKAAISSHLLPPVKRNIESALQRAQNDVLATEGKYIAFSPSK
jgi:hypothetical protein